MHAFDAGLAFIPIWVYARLVLARKNHKPNRTISGYRTICSRSKIMFARKLRRSPTPEEKMVWNYLKGRKTGFSFRRQSVMLGWIVDFWCPSRRIAIEIDGCHHQTQSGLFNDGMRDAQLSDLGAYVLRIPNSRVRTDLSSVISEITAACRKRPVFRSWNHHLRGRISYHSAGTRKAGIPVVRAGKRDSQPLWAGRESDGLKAAATGQRF